MLRLAISNIAWRPEESATAYGILAEQEVRGLEIAPGLLFQGALDPFAPTEAELRTALDPVRAAGLELVSMQSLLFGVQEASLFGDAAARDRFTEGMRRAIVLAGRLSIPHLVMGSPRQREIPPWMERGEAEALALDVFAALGDLASTEGTRIGLEANPVEYGTNFLTNQQDAADFVQRLDHPSVTLTLDLGALRMNGELASLHGQAALQTGRVTHVHLSEPYLAPAPATAEEAARSLAALSRTGYRGWYSIEMKAPDSDALGELGAAVSRLAQAATLCSEGLAT